MMTAHSNVHKLRREAGDAPIIVIVIVIVTASGVLVSVVIDPLVPLPGFVFTAVVQAVRTAITTGFGTVFDTLATH